jgi:hypothetical protein
MYDDTKYEDTLKKLSEGSNVQEQCEIFANLLDSPGLPLRVTLRIIPEVLDFGSIENFVNMTQENIFVPKLYLHLIKFYPLNGELIPNFFNKYLPEIVSHRGLDDDVFDLMMALSDHITLDGVAVKKKFSNEISISFQKLVKILDLLFVNSSNVKNVLMGIWEKFKHNTQTTDTIMSVVRLHGISLRDFSYEDLEPIFGKRPEYFFNNFDDFDEMVLAMCALKVSLFDGALDANRSFCRKIISKCMNCGIDTNLIILNLIDKYDQKQSHN